MSPSANQPQEVPADALSLQTDRFARKPLAESQAGGGEGNAPPQGKDARVDDVIRSASSGDDSVRTHGPQGGRVRSRRRPPKLYRIGELVDYCGMSRQTIHNYTTMGLLQESRWTHGGHRLYDESAFDDLDLIAEMKAQNRSMEYIREYFARLDRSGPDGPAGD